MKNLNFLIILPILLIFTSCRFETKIDSKSNITKSEKKNDMKTDIVKFEKSELFGRWIRTSKIEDSENSKKGIINRINFKDDFTAQIEILDSTGYKTVYGNWEINKEQKIGSEKFNISFKSDIILTFNWNNHHKQISSLSVKELNKRKILTYQKEKFEKE